jgi:ubiquitin-conjugating enzyme E2 variant
MLFILKALGTVLFADFITGLVHWLEDSYWSLETPILGKWIVEPNLAHHKNGQEFLKKSWLESSWDLLIAGILLVFICADLHRLTWEVWLFAVIIVNANQIHKWAHITRDENKPKFIALLQKYYLLQRTNHHGQHHRKPNNTHYCTVTNALNPILDKVGFWRGLEAIFGSKQSFNQ